jgi:DNA repair photolyase
MRIQGGLKQEDWENWGRWTTFKSNAPELIKKEIRGEEVIYCSPMVDPYQPAEASFGMMPRLLGELIARPPAVFTIQTRGPLILRDLAFLQRLNLRTRLRVSFSLTTDREDVRRLYEPLCAPIEERLEVIRALRDAGLVTHATLAPLLPCDPERLALMAVEATSTDVIGDPFHVRAVKRNGATTRPEAERISEKRGFAVWHQPGFQADAVNQIRKAVERAGRRFVTGTEGFRLLGSRD